MTDISCLMCAALRQSGQSCTLHGGLMTATEVNLRDLYVVVNGRWVDRPSDPGPLTDPLNPEALDKMIDWAKRITTDAEAIPPKRTEIASKS